jgi:hypothetical protein
VALRPRLAAGLPFSQRFGDALRSLIVAEQQRTVKNGCQAKEHAVPGEPLVVGATLSKAHPTPMPSSGVAPAPSPVRSRDFAYSL